MFPVPRAVGEFPPVDPGDARPASPFKTAMVEVLGGGTPPPFGLRYAAGPIRRQRQGVAPAHRLPGGVGAVPAGSDHQAVVSELKTRCQEFWAEAKSQGKEDAWRAVLTKPMANQMVFNDLLSRAPFVGPSGLWPDANARTAWLAGRGASGISNAASVNDPAFGDEVIKALLECPAGGKAGGMSTGTKVAIGVGALVGIGALVWFLGRK